MQPFQNLGLNLTHFDVETRFLFFIRRDFAAFGILFAMWMSFLWMLWDGFDVFGASKDSIEKNTKCADKYKLKYELGSDLTDVCEKLGIWIEKSMYGKKYFGINRSTFILDNNGKILHSWTKVKVKDHVDEVLAYIKENKL